MSDIVIKSENLGKKYTIGHQVERGNYTALRDVLMQNARNLWNKTKDLATGKPIIQGDTLEEVWALKDVNFEIRRGEAVGIIGRNGAGKSTLLKILSRITEPTTGRVTIKGRVASLLEVGTGFHPELTGRENIYLNGTILGMTRAEIRQKFDEIVAFAEVEKYLDTPVKRYSSGMYVRLAFAVAAHLEPDILVVDEVLAVGDAQFQKKCLGKMEDVSKSEGRTVLFVSHNMSAISELCAKTIYLKSGKTMIFSSTEAVIPLYLGSKSTVAYKDIYVNSYIRGATTWEKGSQAAIEIKWDKYKFEPGWECDIACYTVDGIKMFAIESQKLDGFNSKDKEINGITFFIENIGFAERDLRVDIGIRRGPNESYHLVINDGVILRSAGNSLAKYRRSDVMVVPNVTYELSVN